MGPGHRPTVALAFWLVLLAGCGGGADGPPPLVLATTTSVEDAGLLDEIVPAFRARTGLEVRAVAVGSGEALALARRGEADVVIAHSPAAELAFMDAGFGERRVPILRNDFVVIGPAGDPAGVRGAGSAAEAFARIARAAEAGRATFVSRGDGSGTHARERALWDAARARPPPGRYVESGSGMAATVGIADQRGAYTLVDRATFLTLERRVDARVVAERVPGFENVYSAILVAPERVRRGHAAGARRLFRFLTGDETGGIVRGWRPETDGGRAAFEWIGAPGEGVVP